MLFINLQSCMSQDFNECDEIEMISFFRELVLRKIVSLGNFVYTPPGRIQGERKISHLERLRNGKIDKTKW